MAYCPYHPEPGQSSACALLIVAVVLVQNSEASCADLQVLEPEWDIMPISEYCIASGAPNAALSQEYLAVQIYANAAP